MRAAPPASHAIPPACRPRPHATSPAPPAPPGPPAVRCNGRRSCRPGRRSLPQQPLLQQPPVVSHRTPVVSPRFLEPRRRPVAVDCFMAHRLPPLTVADLAHRGPRPPLASPVAGLTRSSRSRAHRLAAGLAGVVRLRRPPPHLLSRLPSPASSVSGGGDCWLNMRGRLIDNRRAHAARVAPPM